MATKGTSSDSQRIYESAVKTERKRMSNLGYPGSSSRKNMGPSIISGNMATRDLVPVDRQRMIPQNVATRPAIANLPMPGVRQVMPSFVPAQTGIVNLPAFNVPRQPVMGFNPASTQIANLPAIPGQSINSAERVNRMRAIENYLASLGIR
jgi:hypothetical protein